MTVTAPRQAPPPQGLPCTWGIPFALSLTLPAPLPPLANPRGAERQQDNRALVPELPPAREHERAGHQGILWVGWG